MTHRPRTVAVIQARMGSTRLPGKSLADVAGTPLIGRLLDQLQGCRSLDDVYVATTDLSEDGALERYCRNRGTNVIRGSSADVLERFWTAACASEADVVVRISGDCPLLAPDTVDEVVEWFATAGIDYGSNTFPYSRPEGQDVEIFTREALKSAERLAVEPGDREHVTPFIRRSADFTKGHFSHTEKLPQAWRWSVDRDDDLKFVRAVWRCLDGQVGGAAFFEDILRCVEPLTDQMGKTVINEGYLRSIFESADDLPAVPLKLTLSEAWLARSEAVIPGGAQTYSKSWRHHIRGVSPIFLKSGQGANVVDVDGNQYVDLIQGLLPNILGYANPEVDQAVVDSLVKGNSFSLPTPLEVELAERLCEIIPSAEMVRFGKNGSDATSGAVRVARAFTGRERVAVCGYHGWHDWYIGTTTRDAGVPKGVKALSHAFKYGDLDDLESVLAEFPGEFAAVIMEPVNFVWPEPGYLEEVKRITHVHGALLIFDETTSGFHFGLGGAQKLFGILPDLSTFGKALGNGWPISCVVGRRDVMKTFEDAFVSFTFAGDTAPMAAAVKVLDTLEHSDAYQKMESAGQQICDGARFMARLAGLEGNFVLQGRNSWAAFNFVDDAGAPDPVARAFWIQEVTRRGVLVLTTFNICAALTQHDVDVVLAAFAHAFKSLARAKSSGGPLTSMIDGVMPQGAFQVRTLS